MSKRKLFRKIDISSAEGIDKAIAFLQENLSKDALQQKLDETASALIDEGKTAAESVYPETVSVTAPDPENGVHKLVAKHEGIAFIEFGAGVDTDGRGEFADEADFPVEQGSYSYEQYLANPEKGEFFRTGKWHFGGHEYTGIAPRPGMELARRHIEDNAEKKLKEVFGVD